jgi:histone-lysine N-methyltransferase SETMAR
MSLESVQYRSVIRFLFLKGKNREEIRSDLSTVYGDQCPSQATIYRWYNDFKSGRTSVVDEDKPGRPSEISEGIAEKLTKIIQNERRITTRELTTRLNVSKGSLHTLLASSGIRKLCSRFVPRFLTAEMMDRRLESCSENLKTFERFGDRFLDNIITMDETPLSLYIPESRRESQEWKFQGESCSRKMRSSTCHRKSLMLSVFWDANGIIFSDFAENGVRIDSVYYADLVQRARKLRRKSRVSKLYYLHDNAPIHTSELSSAKIVDCGLELLPHPPYSPDLAPSDFYLFNHLKKTLRGRHFASKEDLKDAVTRFLNEKPPDFFKIAFLDLADRWQKCVDAGGNYFEK